MRSNETARAATRARRGARATAGVAVVLGVSLSLLARGGEEPHEAVAQEPPAVPPNVVVVQADDQRLETFRVMNKVERLLGDQGTTFKNYFATHPVCCPSRASYLTGQYSHNHGVQSNTKPEGGFRALDHSRALPVWLDDEGYFTAHIGKYLNGYNSQGIPPGWDDWQALLGEFTQRTYGYKLNENGRTVEYGGQRSDYQTDVFADKAVEIIREHAPRPEPFFLSVNPTPPHQEDRVRGDFPRGPSMPRNPRPAPRHFERFDGVPLPRPPSFNEKDVSDKPKFIRELPRIDRDKRRTMTIRYRSQLESLLAVDDLVRDVVEALGSTGELDNTVIVFISDNGYFHGEHRIPHKKAKLYEEGTRVPLVVRGPGFPAGATRRQLVGNIDLAPTILDLADAEPSGRVVDGRSLVPLAGDPDAGNDRDLLFENGIYGSTAVRTERYVFMKHDSGEKELYDLERDPYQLKSKDRADSRRWRRVRDELAGRLRRLEDCSGADECR